MFESHDAVDEDDGNVPSITPDEERVEVYIYFPKRAEVFALGCLNGSFGFVAEMTTRSGVECHLSLRCVVHVDSLARFLRR